MRKIVTLQHTFLIPAVAFMLFGTAVVMFTEKSELHLFFNTLHHNFFDFFFKYLTYLGDGAAIAVAAVLLLLFCNIRHGLTLGSIAVLLGIVVQFLKKIVFPDFFRPIKYFAQFSEKAHTLYIVSGAEPASNYSFPSGHTATAFALFLFLAFLAKSNKIKVLYFFIALLTAYSRVYLSWHFFEDIVAGSFVGSLIALFGIFLFRNLEKPKLNRPLFFGNSTKNHIKS